MTKPKTDSYASVWNAITDTPEEAASLRLCSELMDKITALIQKKAGRSLKRQSIAALRNRASMSCCAATFRASLDALVNIAAHLGERVHIELESA